MSESSQPVNSHLIELKQVQHTFNSSQQNILEDINLNIPRGKFITLLGPSGCGKSTLLRIIASLLTPSKGEVKRNFLKQADNHITDLPVSFVFQDPRLLPWRNIYENIRLPFEIAGKPADCDQRIQSVLEAVGLKGEEKKRPSMLSGGMRMRVSLARALVTQPQLLLLDEPFAALDELLRHQLNQELLKLWQAFGWTVIFVTHNISEAVFLSQEIHIMQSHPGRIVKSIEIPFSISDKTESAASQIKKDIRHTPEFLQTVSNITTIMQQGRGTR